MYNLCRRSYYPVIYGDYKEAIKKASRHEPISILECHECQGVVERCRRVPGAVAQLDQGIWRFNEMDSSIVVVSETWSFEGRGVWKRWCPGSDVGNHDWECRKIAIIYLFYIHIRNILVYIILILQSYIYVLLGVYIYIYILHVGTSVHWYICIPHALLRIV